MEKFSYWQYFAVAVLLVFVLVALFRFFGNQRSRELPDQHLQEKNACYHRLNELLNLYTDLIGRLGHEYRYAFNHADQLTVENEEAAEKIIVELDKVEHQIKEKTRQLEQLGEAHIANEINAFLLKESNIRHASPKDLENFTREAPQRISALRDLMQDKSR